ncbi:unnamed protein product [Psylliodes chrysocephalus]|uniref:Uncharacterized protein n=1 Tax=Psylliodes chrysocephalus TaxID=3402493 RepID=A0A9P0GFB4_9CUCU|nr:unnamed protein product [Psylliodes chrysocephala]
MSERKKIIIALATQHKVVCVQEAGDLKNHYSELTSFGQNCSELAQDSFEDDSLDQQETHTFKNINEFTLHSNNSVPDQSNSKCSTLEQHVEIFENQNYDYNNICAKEKDLFEMQPYSVSKITDETKKVSAKVYFEMKPLSPINEVEYGRRELLFTELQSPSSTKNDYVRQESQTVCTNKSLNETNLTKTYSKEQSTPQNDNTDDFHQYEEACDQSASFNRHQDYPNSIKVYCADMQKVLLLPKLSLKSSVFVSKLVVFNETFASLTKDEENICILWHEAISGRTAEDVASAYCAIIQRASVEVEHYEFWCDNCIGQNKNWKLFTSFVVIANSNWGPQSITLKYFEPGHSYMRADSVHGNIGKSWKKKSNIYDMNELNELILKTSRKNKTLIMKHDDF